MLGVSLSPRLFWPEQRNECDRKLLDEFGGLPSLLRFLRGQGVTHVELRPVRPDEDPAAVLCCAQAVWDAGLHLSVHGEVPGEVGPFAATCPSLLPLLAQAGRHQQPVMITLHSYTTGDDTDVAPAIEKTRRLLKLWGSEADRYGFRLALELNRDKHNGDPSVTLRGVLWMLEGTSPDAVGICFDFGHYYSNIKTSGLGEGAVPGTVFLERVIHTHIHALGSGGTHFPLDGSSELPLDNYVQALAQSTYGGVYNLELDFSRYPDRSFRQAIRDSLVALKGALSRALPKFDAQRAAVAAATDRMYPAALAGMAKKIAAPQTADCLYTFCASGQIFCVGNSKFAVDPAIRTPQARDASLEAVRSVLSQMSAVFVTHQHEDHFDPVLVRQLADLNCIWVVGDSFPGELLENAGLKPEQVLTVKPGDTVEVSGIRAQVFEGCHFQPDGTGVPAVMYLITAGGKRIFLPGDVRDYGVDRFPVMDPPDCMVANVWLGRGQACRTDDGAFEEFCDYIAYFRPKTVLLGHLLEYTRESSDMWSWEHAGRVMDGLAQRLPEVPVFPLRMFQRYEI